MTYKFEPFWVRFRKSKFRDSNIYFNFSLQDYCGGSFGVSIFLKVSMYYQFEICLKPFGEIIYKP